MKLHLFLLTFSMMFALVHHSHAHDTWVEVGNLAVKKGEYIFVDLRLGNHGNNHRDFKLASKITLAPCELRIVSPSGAVKDVKSQLLDMGTAEKEGYWTSRFVPQESGVHEVIHQLDTLHGKVRAVKSSKTYFVVGADSLGGRDLQPVSLPVHNFGLELVLETPIDQLSARTPIQVRLMRNGKPLAGHLISFIPRGAVLSEGEDSLFEKRTNSDGRATFTPPEGNLVLAVAHFIAEDEKGEAYEKTHYGATMVLAVPQNPLNGKLAP